jgi:DNA polymerase bacteriophage-type
MTNDIILDFETRSRCDLLERGASNYALDPSTEILCLAVVYKDPAKTKEWLWFPHISKTLPRDMRKAIEDADLIMAHNAAFDRDIYRIGVEDFDFPEIPFDKWYCTSAQARVNAMPASLDNLTQALDSNYKKDHRGSALIKLLSIPNKDTGEFNEYPKALLDMGAYCLDDTRATKSASNALRPMTKQEHEDWLVNERINERGVMIDVELATNATKYAAAEQGEISTHLTRLTNGAATKHTQHQRVRTWVMERVCKDVIEIMTKRVKGEVKYSMDASIRDQLLTKHAIGAIELTDDVVEVIELVQAGSKSSVSKFKNMLLRADDEDSRVRGAFVYAGASQTLRFAARGLQLHNFIRDCFSAEQTEDLKEQMREGYILEDDEGDLPVMSTLSKLLRPALIPAEGNVLVVGDWSSVEARALPWLANSRGAEKKLDIFREGKDIYVEAALAMGMTDSKEDRQIGKVSELSLGYGGGKGAFGSMAKNYGVVLPDHEVEKIVEAWRYKNRWAVNFWDALQTAAFAAMKSPGTEFEAGHAKYLFVKNLMGGTLLCILPGDCIIQYPKARLEVIDGPYGANLTLTAMKANWTPKQGEKEWPRIGLWRGLLAENITQAFCARLLRNVLVDCPDVIGHVHDEVIMEVPIHRAVASRDLLEIYMNTVPSWAEGMPLDAEPTLMTRYGK